MISNLQDHGIAVHNGACLSMKPWRDATTGRDYVYVGLISTTSLIVQVDVASGRSRSFYLPPDCEGPWGMAFTLDGHVLVTSVSGQLCRLNPQTGKVWVTARTDKWLWHVDRGADGKFYVASSPDCRLFRYDATTEKLEDLGSLSKTQVYLRGVVGGPDGYVYCSVGCTASQILAYHIATGKTKPLLPAREVGPQFASVLNGPDGQIYAISSRGNTYRLAHGAAFPATRPEGWGEERLPDGRVVTGVDADALNVGGKIIPYRYKTGGANVFHLAEGPNQTVYGSTIMPLYLLRYTPKTKKLENLGRGGPDNGETYSIGHCDGKLYYANYSLGNLMRYDPAKPWHKDLPGAMKWKTNPQWLGYLGKGNCRPRAMCIDSQKRVWVGGVPEYGYRDGGLACYDIRRKKLTVLEKFTPDQSIDALAADAAGRILYGGTNIGRGAGLRPVTKAARLFAWDTQKKKTLWSIVPVPGMHGLNNLLYRDGKLYGTTVSSQPGTNRFTFFCFDPLSRQMDYLIPSEISGAREQSMCLGPDGNIYGITWMVLFRWRPETGKIEEVYRCMGEDAKPFGGSLFGRGAIIIDGRYYFSCGTKIMSVHLPLETSQHSERLTKPPTAL